MKLQTKSLTGAALDWCVAKCERYEAEPQIDEGFWLEHATATPTYLHNYTPSTDWAQGGPLIQRERINVGNYHMANAARVEGATNPMFAFRAYPFGSINSADDSYGPTPLIAAMRCYVASKLGAEIEVPAELCV